MVLAEGICRVNLGIRKRLNRQFRYQCKHLAPGVLASEFAMEVTYARHVVVLVARPRTRNSDVQGTRVER